MNFQRIVEIARAIETPSHTHKHFTFAFRKNKLLAIGINNHRKTHPKILKHKYKTKSGRNAGIHSELSAILKLQTEDCSDITFVNLRIRKDNLIGMAKPCGGCLSLLEQTGFKRLFFSDNRGIFQELT